VAGRGGFVYGPRDIPHTFTVSSDQARFLLVTEPAAFDGFVRAPGQPAERLEIPDGAGGPPDMGALVATDRSRANEQRCSARLAGCRVRRLAPGIAMAPS
jgi:hypothetical protein